MISALLFVVAVLSFGFVQYRNRIATDIVPPVIEMAEDVVQVSVNATEEEMLAGITATDNRDGDVTANLLVESKSNFLETSHRMISILASDASGNVTKVNREIVYTDYQRPRFKLESPLRFQSGSQINILEDLSAKDSLDGDLTDRIKISSDNYILVDEPGDYPMEFYVSNSAGDTIRMPVTVTIYDQAEENGRPSIELNQYIVYTKVGKKLNPWDYVQRITYRNQEYERSKKGTLRTTSKSEHQDRYTISSDEVEMKSSVNYKKPGTYEILYRFAAVEDPEEEDYGSVRLVVVVRK